MRVNEALDKGLMEVAEVEKVDRKEGS